MLLRKTNPMLTILNSTLIDLPTPSNISYLWNFGSLLGACLLVQIISGLFLAMHFCAETNLAFHSVSHISRNVNNGWLLRSIHANGASLFFFLTYIHIGRGLYQSSFHLKFTWMSGLLMVLLLMATAFLGYVLPWGQMSFWGATVITNLLTAIPYVGMNLTVWIWGGFSIDNATLSRFFTLHFVLPFMLIFLMMIHLMFLHETGSNNPLGTPMSKDKVPFHPYFYWKDILGLLIVMMMFILVVMMAPYNLSDPDNFSPANPLITPPHIQPEWYFLFAYAILRSIPNKLGGVLALFFSILILFTLTISMSNKFSPMYMYPFNKIIFWFYVNTFITLTFLGACPVETPYVQMSQFFTVSYFSFFIIKPIFSKKCQLN